jgi:hypothetical protein
LAMFYLPGFKRPATLRSGSPFKTTLHSKRTMFAVGAKRQKQTPLCRFVRMVFIAQR